jgi:hypothetical protein
VQPAVLFRHAGLGDPLNCGIRVLHMLDDAGGIIAGMANTFNIAPDAGWKLRRLEEGTSAVVNRPPGHPFRAR